MSTSRSQAISFGIDLLHQIERNEVHRRSAVHKKSRRMIGDIQFRIDSFPVSALLCQHLFVGVVELVNCTRLLFIYIYLLLVLYAAVKFASLVLRPLLEFVSAPQIARLLSNDKSAAQVPNHRCQLHCTTRTQFVATVQRIANTACLPVQRSEN